MPDAAAAPKRSKRSERSPSKRSSRGAAAAAAEADSDSDDGMQPVAPPKSKPGANGRRKPNEKETARQGEQWILHISVMAQYVLACGSLAQLRIVRMCNNARSARQCNTGSCAEPTCSATVYVSRTV